MARFIFIFLFFIPVNLFAQAGSDSLNVEVVDEQNNPAIGTSIELFAVTDSSLLKTAITDERGQASFTRLKTGNYRLRFTHKGFEIMRADVNLPYDGYQKKFRLKPASTMLQDVSVKASRPFIQQLRGKLVVNVDAAITNAGTTVLEVLEKSPGILVDKNGSISMQGKSGVLVMMDDKPTYLSGADLVNMLSGMSSSQVDQIELITNPSARYDAAGNAGIINIKTKKNKQEGFNGTLTLSAGHGRFYKNSNSLLLNYRKGKLNAFMTSSITNNKFYTDIYALRSYFYPDGSLSSTLDQPSYFKGTFNHQVLKSGVDFFLSDKTSIGIVFTGTKNNRNSGTDARATWLNRLGTIDSSIQTNSKTKYNLSHAAVNGNLRQKLNSQQDIAVDIDYLDYDINNDQAFYNRLLAPGGYNDASQGYLPARIKIFTLKADHTWKISKDQQLETGVKSAHTRTDNLAGYQYFDGVNWQEDLGKSNHFLYDEKINAVYSSFQQKIKKWSYQAGLRYENTRYTANQLGNTINKDSSFSRQYAALFPSAYISVAADSNHTLTFTASRRIDRPAFQKLNPFVFIINKYTHQQGNPFFRPQYSWNIELSHQYKQFLTTTLAYTFIKDYFSQLFLSGPGDILIYAEGNVGRAYNLGLSMSTQLQPFKCWSFTAQGMFNYKKLNGYVWNNYQSDIRQFNFSMNNQFKLGKVYTAELSGFYTGRARNDLQELLYPNSQVVVGLARPILKKKGTVKMSMRDIFYSNGMEGLTDFRDASEYFILRRDSRIFTLSFVYRFGKPLKAVKRSGGSAADEMQRAGS